MRWFGPGLTVAGVMAAVLGVVTGTIDLPSLDRYRGETAPVSLQPIPVDQMGRKTPDRIRIATFNIKRFADDKANNPAVMQRIAQVASLVDVLAIQEVMGGARSVGRLVDLLNQSTGDSRYQYTASPPIGRTTYLEHYAFVWDASRVSLIPDSAYVVDDGEPGVGQDLMHREPYVASFQARLAPAASATSPLGKPFRFTLINVHTDPDEVSGSVNELNVLDDVFNSVRSYEYQLNGERDFILLGDLNVGVEGLGELGAFVVSLAGTRPTNVIGTRQIDHILIDPTQTKTFLPGQAGVMDFVNDFGMTQEEAAAVSDHLPVFADFSAIEPADQAAAAGKTVAAQSGATTIMR